MRAIIVLFVSAALLPAQTPKAKAPVKKAPAAERPNPALLNPATFRATAPELFRVRFVTSHGDFVVEARRDWSPIGADRFYNLVRGRFFTNVAFFRFVQNFIVQFGISPDPVVTAAWSKAPIKDDPARPGVSNTKGTVVFAKTQLPNSRTTQFFINLANNAQLDASGFTPFGTVSEGMQIVEGLYSAYGDMKEMGGPGPSQELLTNQGKPYLDQNFPRLDSIKSATIIFPEPATPPAPAKKAVPAVKKSIPAVTPARK